MAFSAQGLHSASIPGILALDLCPSDTNKILTGKSGPSPASQDGGGRVWEEVVKGVSGFEVSSAYWFAE